MNPSTEFIPFSRPSIGDLEERAVLRVLRSGWLTTGPECRAFEEEFSRYLGSDHAIAVSSATAGLHLALEAWGIGKGDRVAVPTYTFTATAEVVHYLGAEPVFIDCAPGSFQMDVQVIEDTLRKRPGWLKAVIPVHFGGEPCFPNFWKLAKDRGLVVIEDCAHAFPVRTEQGFLGTLGHAGVFSFYANKTMTTGEGGMVVTNDAAAATRMRRMRLHGIDRDAFERFRTRTPSWRYDVVAAGYKYNMPDLAAAVGRAQLLRAEDLLASRRKIASLYADAARDFPLWTFPTYRSDHAWHLFPILVDQASVRDRVIERLGELGIGSSVHYIPLHRMSFWRDLLGLSPQDFPYAEDRGQREISLPLWAGMEASHIRRVLEALHQVYGELHG